MAVAMVAFIVGACVSLASVPYVMRHLFPDQQNRTFERWSSDGKNWSEFSEFIAAGGRAYWSIDEIFNWLDPGMDEKEIRRSIGPPDAAFIGKAEMSKSIRIGRSFQFIQQDNRQPVN